MAARANVYAVLLGVALCAVGTVLHAEDAKAIVQKAVDTELAASRNDHSHWRYVKQEAGGNEFVVVETENGAISRQVKENGHPVSKETMRADDEYIQRFIQDPSLRAKQKRDSEHDDKGATELTNLLPTAFVWKVESETPEAVTLSFRPAPDFHPPDMESRVMGLMAGTMVVDKAQHRIRTLKGALTEDVNIGFGILGRLHKDGTFNVERKQLAPGLWQITDTHVHIEGRALFFKSIGEQQDEVKTHFTLVPAGTTLEQAAEMLKQPTK